MSRDLRLSTEERATLTHILRAHLKDNARVHIFGSRTTANCKPWSDLDIVIDAQHPLPLSLLADLAEAFDESSLPWKVDIVDRLTVGEEFGRLIDASKVALDYNR